MGKVIKTNIEGDKEIKTFRSSINIWVQCFLLASIRALSSNNTPVIALEA